MFEGFGEFEFVKVMVLVGLGLVVTVLVLMGGDYIGCCFQT